MQSESDGWAWGGGEGGILNKGVREDFSAKGSFEKNLNEVQRQAMLMGSIQAAMQRPWGLFKSRAKSPVNLQHEYNYSVEIKSESKGI